jgi:hypothetical protein
MISTLRLFLDRKRVVDYGDLLALLGVGVVIGIEAAAFYVSTLLGK